MTDRYPGDEERTYDDRLAEGFDMLDDEDHLDDDDQQSYGIRPLYEEGERDDD